VKSYLVDKLKKILDECDKHLLRMNGAHSRISALLPLNAEHYASLSDDEVTHIDQYLFRFSKLQDAMGEKLFKTLLLFLDEEVDGKAFMDLLNKLEKLSLLESAECWRELRNIRNSLSHQYDNDPVNMCIALNSVFEAKESIESIYLHLKRYFNAKIAPLQ